MSQPDILRALNTQKALVNMLQAERAQMETALGAAERLREEAYGERDSEARRALRFQTERDELARIARIYSLVALYDASDLTEGQAAKLMGCDRVSWRLRREQVHAEMKALLASGMKDHGWEWPDATAMQP